MVKVKKLSSVVKKAEMSELDMEEFLEELFNGYVDNSVINKVISVTNYRDAGFLTSNKGIEVCFKDGSCFQLTIVKSA